MLPGYQNHRPSGLNLYAACPSMFVAEYILGLKQPVGAPAHRGTAVEDGVAHGLKNGRDATACSEVALRKFTRLMATSSDSRVGEYKRTIPPMVQQTLVELTPYGEPSELQRAIVWRPDELQLPIVGHSDFVWDRHGIVLDLKTTDKCPSEIKISHARQVAMYAGSDNADGRVCYVTPKRLAVYRLENIRAHRQALVRIALAVERLLSLSDEPAFYQRLVVPDLDSFYWKTPAARAIAFKHWGV